MDSKLIKKEGYKVELEIALTKEEFDGYINKAYSKDKNKYTVQGFRKGKAPQYLIERIYGKGIFYDTAMDLALNAEYPKAVEELELDVVDYPRVDLKDMDDDNGLVFTIEVDVKPEVELGKYKGVEIEKIEVSVTDEEVEDKLKNEAEKNSRMVSIDNRPVEKDDTVLIDYEGFVDDVAFEGGKGEQHDLVIGSNSFIPGFEDQLIGHKTGETFDINVKFPDEYHSEDLKGKDAVFKVTIHDIKVKELPVVDDEFIKDISEYDTVAQYKEETKKQLQERKEKDAQSNMKEDALMAACDNAKVDIPNAMVEQAIDRIIDNMRMEMQYSGGYTLEQYFAYTGMKMEDLREHNKVGAKRMVVRDLVLEAIKKAEDIQVTDQEIDEELEKEAKLYSMEVEQVKKALGDYKSYYTDRVADEKIKDLIYSNAKKVKDLSKKKEEAKKADTQKKETKKKTTSTAKSTKKDTEKVDKPAKEVKEVKESKED